MQTNELMPRNTKNGKQKSGSKSQGRVLVTRARSEPRTVAQVAIAKQASSSVGDGVSLSHREFVASVTGNSADFLLLGPSAVFPGFDLNPGNSILFPWLSIISLGYEKYRFEKLVFHIMPRNASTATGTVFAAVDYDWDDQVPTSMSALLINKGSVASSVWSPFNVVIDCSRMNSELPYRFVSDAPRFSADSQRMVYAGYFMIGIQGTSSSVTFDIEVEYKVSLRLPCLPNPLPMNSITFPNTVELLTGAHTPYPLLPNVGAMPTVLSGINGVPNFVGFDAGSTAYRLPNSGRGTFTLQTNLASSGHPPSDYGSDTLTDAYVYSNTGAVIASSVSALGAAALFSLYQGVNDPARWNTNNYSGVSVMQFYLSLLKLAYPAAAYILPIMRSTLGRTLAITSRAVAQYSEL